MSLYRPRATMEWHGEKARSDSHSQCRLLRVYRDCRSEMTLGPGRCHYRLPTQEVRMKLVIASLFALAVSAAPAFAACCP